MSWHIHHGDVRKILKTLPIDHFDGVLSDPPYAYKFMGNRWDYALPSVNVWTELLRVVKPGAHVMLFGGPRTFHRLVCSVEDAGFLPIDLLMYMHGKGFPKSLDIAKAIDKQKGHWRGRAGKVKSSNGAMGGPNLERTEKGPALSSDAKEWEGYGTALKPAYEPVLLAMKMLDGTFANNVQKWGTGALAVDLNRVGEEGESKTIGGFNAPNGSMFNGVRGGTERSEEKMGRWPTDVAMNEDAAAFLNAQVGEDVARFFYTAKVSRSERDAGCGGIEEVVVGDSSVFNAQRAQRNIHPTLKPIELVRWLASLLLPPPRKDGQPRRILVPFSGAASEMIGCLQAGWDEVIGIEGQAEYIEIAKARITKGGVFSGLLDKKMRKPARERASIGPSRVRKVREG